MDPRTAPAHFNLASLYEQSGERSRAMERYRSFLEFAGADHAARVPAARARIAFLERQD